MDIKKIAIALAVQILVEKKIISKPDTTEAFITNLFGGETEQERMARQIDEASDKAIEAVKTFRLNRQFKKVTKNF